MYHTEHEWIEVWIDGYTLGYILLLRKKLGIEAYEIVDLKEEFRVIETFTDYEDAYYWLREDEYDLVEGRISIDDT